MLSSKIKFILLVCIIFSFFPNQAVCQEVALVTKVKGKRMVVSRITDESITLDSKFYYVLDDKNKVVGWLKIIKIKNHLGLFEILKGEAQKGQRLIRAKFNDKKYGSNNFLKSGPWRAVYKFNFGTIDSKDTLMKSSMSGHSFLSRFRYNLNPRFQIVFLGGLKLTQAETTYDSSTKSSASDIAPIGSASISYFINGGWSTYAFSSFDRYSVSKIQSASEASQAFVYKNSSGGGVEKRWNHGFMTRADLALVLPTKSSTNNLKSGFEFGLEGTYDWRSMQFAYRGTYQSISTGTGTDTGIMNSLMIGYNF